MRIYRIKKTINAFIIMILIFCILLIGISIKVASESKDTYALIDEFKSKGVYVGDYKANYKNEQINSYYKVTIDEVYTNSSDRIYSTSYSDAGATFTDKYIGTTGDVFLSSYDPIGLLYTKWMSRKIFIGHCGIVYDEDGTKTIEVTGNSNKKENVVKECENDWIENSSDKLIVLRSKNDIKKDEMKEWLDDNKGIRYNYFFLINMGQKRNKKFYCTDLILNCYIDVEDREISKRNNLVTGSSIINNEQMYIIYYKEKSKKEGIDYDVYFLSGETNE